MSDSCSSSTENLMSNLFQVGQQPGVPPEIDSNGGQGNVDFAQARPENLRPTAEVPGLRTIAEA